MLLIRRSQTVKNEVMARNKTGRQQRLLLPPALVDIVKWHVEQLPDGPMAESDLLCPSEKGGVRSASSLDKPFASISKTLKLTKDNTPRAMRRTLQDLARADQVADIVTLAISGHATAEMQQHYSTAGADEQLAGLAKVISLAGPRGDGDDRGTDARSGGKVVGQLGEEVTTAS